MLQSWMPIDWFQFSFNGPSWSISTEFAFYLAFPWLVKDFSGTWWWKLLGCAGIVGALMWFCWFAEVKNIYGTMLVWPPARLLEFVLGMCAALLWRRYGSQVTLGVLVGTLAEVAAIGFVVLTMQMGAGRFFLPPIWAWFSIGAGLGAAPAAALLILVFAVGAGIVSKALRSPVLVILGEVSYSLYLLHGSLLYVAMNQRVLSGLYELVAYSGVCLVASFAAWQFVEKPMRGLVKRYSLRSIDSGHGGIVAPSVIPT